MCLARFLTKSACLILFLSGIVCGQPLDQTVMPATGDYPRFAVPRLEGETIPGLPPVTGRIKIDQFGYLPDAHKVAVISDPQIGYNAMDSYTPGEELQVRRREDGTIFHRGAPKVWNDGAVDEISGDRGWWFDFSKVREPGEYYVFDPSTGLRSPVFRIAADVYYPILTAAVRTYFYQRLGVPLQPPHAEEPWVDDASLLQDREARAVWAQDDPTTARDLCGGWMDAGDTNKYPPFNHEVIHQLLYAYRANPDVFGDDFNIPESGNGLPDLLDELKFQLEWLLRMQEEEGGVFIKMGNITYAGFVWPLSKDRRPRFYGPPCTGASIVFAGTIAHAARVYGQFEEWKEFAEELRERSLRAWDWYQATPHTTDLDDGTIKAGIANRSVDYQRQAEAFAAIHLWTLTGEDRFKEALLRWAPTTRQLSEGAWSVYMAGSGESLVEYARMAGADPELAARIREQLFVSASSRQWAPPAETSLYRSWMSPGSYHWGSNQPRASFGFSALLAAEHGGLEEDDRRRLRQRARDLLHHFHGVNPHSMVHLTNMGRFGAELYPTRIWHERFNFNTPLAENPPPGYVPGGPNQTYGGSIEWISEQPPAKAYADFNEPWPLNSWEITENAIYYQAAYIRLLAEFVRLPAD